MQPEVSALKQPDGSVIYRVEAAGICAEHGQWWQAATLFHAMCRSKGIECTKPVEPELP